MLCLRDKEALDEHLERKLDRVVMLTVPVSMIPEAEKN